MKYKQSVDKRLQGVFYSNLIRFSFIITIPVVLMFFGLYGFVTYHHAKQATYFVDYSVQNLHVECDNILRQAEMQGIKLTTNEAVIAYVASNGSEHTSVRAQEFLSAYQGLNSYFESVKLYSFSGMNYIDAFRYDSITEAEVEGLDVPMYKLKGREVQLLPIAKNGKYPYLVRLMFPIYIGSSKGAVVIDINVEKFGLYTHNLSIQDTLSNFVCCEGKVVFGNDLKQQFNKPFADFVQEDGKFVNYAGKKYIIEQRGSDYYPFTYTSLVLSDYFSPSKLFLTIFFLIGILISIGFAFFIALSITRRSISPFDMLIKMIEAPSNWEFLEEDLPPEISYIAEALRKKFQKGPDIEKELAGRLLLLKAAELQTMQMQMNPHFLYNVLDILSWELYSHLGIENAASKRLTELSEMYRMCVNKKGYIVTLAWEINYVQTYFNLVQYIEDRNITLDIQLDEDLLEYDVVKFMLQPLVENAINHGLKENKSIHIYVSAELDGDSLLVHVEDDGAGMSDEQIALFNAELSEAFDMGEELSEMIVSDVEGKGLFAEVKPTGKGSGMALNNINRRIKMLMGEQCGLFLSTSSYGGLRVTANMISNVCAKK